MASDKIAIKKIYLCTFLCSLLLLRLKLLTDGEKDDSDASKETQGLPSARATHEEYKEVKLKDTAGEATG